MNTPDSDDVTLDRPQYGFTEAKHPKRIGRYRIERVLGHGGFGLVYLAHDETLDRPVAVKVPHAKLVSCPEDAEQYLAEARTVASLEHPNIVPVHDVGNSAEFPCFVVSRFVPGSDLATHLKQTRLTYLESAGLVTTIAEALHYAHKRGIVHRDIKPGNILIDADGQPFIVDFGLALREDSVGKGTRHGGTPAYMSPEQVRGEGHRVDGRSDIFSLGVLFYEMLAGRRPFRGDTHLEVFDQIQTLEPRPLSQYDERIPKELQRICLKALSKRASERYSSAHEMAEDLRHFLESQDSLLMAATTKQTAGSAEVAGPTISTHSDSAKSTPPNTHPDHPSESQLIKIIPKGLRSFDAHDADFFLELLPGPRDRVGLPDSLRFWKTHIEETDPDNTFSVGLIYGPSGCGKSSLVKAGLLPRLSPDVISCYIEATPEETESRLLRGLRKRCPALEGNLSLKDTLAALRRGQGIPIGKKVLIVLDQFEQWLHARTEESNAELVQALRQCDGGRVQCIVMVRDDFWLAVSRFLRELEVRLVEGQNSALTDLFDLNHARKVLAAFGRAFGKLPENIGDTTAEQKEFIKQSVTGLAEEGKVICVRLALFAEMMKGKTWTPTSLKEVGGTKGVGVTFLEETFSASNSPPEHRYHQKAARAVLKALLPDTGTDIKGYMRSRAELLEASGYASRPKEFDDLIQILDSEIRLITPTDPEGKETDDDSLTQTQTGQKYFQLTHDYLVHSLREWLTRKQKETRNGRAELTLLDTSVTWNARPEDRFLPSLREFLNIYFLTDNKKWTDPQRKMMGKAGRMHGLRSALALIGLIALVTIGSVVRTQFVEQQQATRIEGLVGRLVSADPSQLPEIIKELDTKPEVAAKFLTPFISREAKTVDEKRAQLHARMALLSRDSSLVEPLVEELLSGRVTYVLPVRHMLGPYASKLTELFRSLLRDEKAEPQRRFRAALALADYVPESEAAWSDVDLRFVAQELVSSNAEFQPLLREALRPIHVKLLPELERMFSDKEASAAQHLSAANAFADYVASDIAKLSELLTVATPEQYAVIYPLVAANLTPAVIENLDQIAATLPPEALGSAERVMHGQRRANVAVTMLRLGEQEKILPMFNWTDDPEALTQFIFRCKPRGIGIERLLDLLESATRNVSEARSATSATSIHSKSLSTASGFNQVNARYALMLAIGEYQPGEIPASRRAALVNQLADWYANDPSSGVHSAAGWLLRHLGEHEIVTRVDQTPVPYSSNREWFTLAITVTPSPSKTETNASIPTLDAPSQDEAIGKKDESDNTTPAKDEENPKSLPEPLPSKAFYYTFIVFPAGEYLIGSVSDEHDRQKYETRHTVALTSPFAILDREITIEELTAFSPDFNEFMLDTKPSDAGFGANWYDAVGFCRWLSQQSGISEQDQSYPDPESLDKERYPREPNPAAKGAPLNWPLELARKGFRLPTESEWEVASRAGSRTAYGFGSDVSLLGKFGWFNENSGKRVHSPRELRPTVRGVFDMHGNLCEWTHDWYVDFLESPVTDPVGSEGSARRVFRGGSWYFGAANCRSADRLTFEPAGRAKDNGFRLALSLPSLESSSAK